MNEKLIEDIEKLGLKFKETEGKEYIFNHQESDVDFFVEDCGMQAQYYYNRDRKVHKLKFCTHLNHKISYYELDEYDIILEKIKRKIGNLGNSENGLITPNDYFNQSSISDVTTGASGALKQYWHYPCIFAGVKTNYVGVILMKLKRSYTAYLYFNCNLKMYINQVYVLSIQDGVEIYNDLVKNHKEVMEMREDLKQDLIAKLV